MVNYDDDDEDSVGDTYDGFNGDSITPNDDDLNSDENDLLKIYPRVDTPISSDIVKLSTLPDDSSSCIKIWSSPDKQVRIIPHPNNDNDYFNEWPASSLPQELWVEGMQYGSDKKIIISYKGLAANPDQWVSPTEDLELTVVEVNMDMEGVQDDSYQYWDETHEIFPGGFIALGEMKSLELKQVLPTEITGTVKLDVVAGGSKIEIYGDPPGSPISLPAYYYTPSGLPKDLNVKGIVASDQPRDVILKFTHLPTDFNDVIKLTIVGVAVNLSGYDRILMYTGDHADDTPTQNYNAVGSPSGGTFSWECSTIEGGDGLLEIVNTQTDPPISTVTVKGAQPSTIPNDAKITVSYTVGDYTATETIYVTVRRPASTYAFRGYFDWQIQTKRHYFHRVYDQFNVPLNITGIPCDEDVRIIYGEKSATGPGNTAFWGAEMHPDYFQGNWPGGIAVRDILGSNTTRTYDSKYEQDIYVGGWLTWPTFEIYIQPLEDQPWPCIWKDPKIE